MEAVQLHGGNGYMSEFHVEQLARRQGAPDLRRHRRDPDNPYRQGPAPQVAFRANQPHGELGTAGLRG